jgi:hypothetical protein
LINILIAFQIFELGEFLPNPFIKGIQPNYIEDVDVVEFP